MRRSPKVLLFAALATAVAAGGCSSALSDFVGVSAHNVYITAGNPQPAAQGDSVYFSISNSGVASAYLQRCGDEPALDYQVWQNNAWVEMGPAITCPAPSTPGPIQLDPGAPLMMSTVYTTPGRYRVGVSAASRPDLSDAAMAWTVGFSIN